MTAQYQYIDDATQLAAFCLRAQQKDILAVDTEFVRTRTLYPQLGLVQLYDGESLVLVDPVAIDDLSPLTALMTNNGVTKILHSCSEDLETFSYALGVIPTPIFDTQLAASLLDMGPTLGYAKLVEICLGVELDKGESRTDWLARPLSEQQLAYAANDVLYLYQLYPQLAEKIEEMGRTSWVVDDIALLGQKKQSSLPLELTYLSVKNNWQLRGKSLALLKELAAWRLQTAREKNMALNFIIKETAMLDIARRFPKSRKDLFAIPGMHPKDVRHYGDEILKMVEQASDIPPEHYPDRVERLVDYPEYKKTAQAIRQLCLQKAEANKLPVELLGSKKQINQYLKWCWFELDEARATGLKPDLLCTWRYQLLGDELSHISSSARPTNS